MPVWCLPNTRLLTAIWIGCAVGGMVSLANYDTAPGSASEPPLFFPATSQLPPMSQRPALLMFVHPKCPCSSASVNELARIAARSRSRIDLTAVFVVPPECPANWHNSAIWANANSIPGLRVVADHGGKCASQFGVATSGHCLVYDAHQKLVFSGGITAGRGHEGDSPGQTVITGIASRATSEAMHACPTYGCPLNTNPVESNETFDFTRD